MNIIKDYLALNLKSFLLLLCISFLNQAFAQSDYLTEINAKLKTTKVDTIKIKLLIEKALELSVLNKNEANVVLIEAKGLANKTNNLFYKATICNTQGDIEINKNNYILGSNHHFEAYKIWKQLNIPSKIAYSYLGMAQAEFYLSNYARALDNYYEALKIYQKSNNIEGLNLTYSGLGSLQMAQNRYDEALVNYQKAYELCKSQNDLIGLSANLNNMGLAYAGKGEYENALKQLFASIDIDEEVGDDISISYTLNNLGEVYDNKGDREKALNYYLQSIETKTLFSDDYGLSYTYANLGNLYLKENNTYNAIDAYNQALAFAQKAENKEELKKAHNGLAIAYSRAASFEKAYFHKEAFAEIVNGFLAQQRSLSQIEVNFRDAKRQEEQETQRQLQESKDKIKTFGLIGIGALLALFSIWQYNRYRLKKKANKVLAHSNELIRYEKQRSDELLLNILPLEIAEELKKNGNARANKYENVTVLFSDFKGFTSIAEQMTPEELVQELHSCFKVFDRIMSKYGIEKIKTIGDAYMCVSGLPKANINHAENMIHAAIEMVNFINSHKAQRIADNKPFFEIRIGINTGNVVAGIVGIKKFAFDIWGDTVNIAARMESSSEPGKINISSSTYDLVKSHFKCDYRGKIEAKNKGAIDMYFVAGLLNP